MARFDVACSTRTRAEAVLLSLFEITFSGRMAAMRSPSTRGLRVDDVDRHRRLVNDAKNGH